MSIHLRTYIYLIQCFLNLWYPIINTSELNDKIVWVALGTMMTLLKLILRKYLGLKLTGRNVSSHTLSHFKFISSRNKGPRDEFFIKTFRCRRLMVMARLALQGQVRGCWSIGPLIVPSLSIHFYIFPLRIQHVHFHQLHLFIPLLSLLLHFSLMNTISIIQRVICR